jgi:hypothetical protein
MMGGDVLAGGTGTNETSFVAGADSGVTAGVAVTGSVGCAARMGGPPAAGRESGGGGGGADWTRSGNGPVTRR